MNKKLKKKVAEAKKAAIQVLLHNFKLDDPAALPMASSWGYFEAYTRDILISLLGIITLEKEDYEDEINYQKMIDKLHLVLKTLAQNQTEHGHITSIVDEKNNRGSSDTTPLFIFAASLFREVKEEKKFLDEAIQKAKTWMEYQSPDDSYLVGQLETTDWRDEFWNFQGYCTFVNTIVYSYLQFSDDKNDRERAEKIKKQMNQYIPNGLLATHNNFYAMCVSKRCVIDPENIDDFNMWFDLLGNSLAIISGITLQPEIRHLDMDKRIITHVENVCNEMHKNKELVLDLPPNFFPFVNKKNWRWCRRYEIHNKPGNYLNGGIWPFVCAFYIAALVAAGEMELAEKKLAALTDLVKLKREPVQTDQTNLENVQQEKNISFGFNEWFKAQDDWYNSQNKIKDESFQPQNEWFKARDNNDDPIMGHNWQTWTAALYLYAAKCVETKTTPFFDKIRNQIKRP
ncbi:MAG: amylo-alpha-1,6-glucosidase [Acidobacteria bacterium]|jgi:hypothetical protein|nr:amylo-alpha-1,6-glucosidase [Acidobacteriota bacterium]